MTADVDWMPMMDDKVNGRGPQMVLEGMPAPAIAEPAIFTLIPNEFVTDGDRVFSIGSFRSAHRTTGRSIEVDDAHVWEIRSGKIARFCHYISTPRGLRWRGRPDHDLRSC